MYWVAITMQNHKYSMPIVVGGAAKLCDGSRLVSTWRKPPLWTKRGTWRKAILLWEKQMMQRFCKLSEGQDAVPEKSLKNKGINIYHYWEDEEMEPSLGSGCNFSSDKKAIRLLLASIQHDRKLENEEEHGLTVIQIEVVLKAVSKTILEWKKRV